MSQAVLGTGICIGTSDSTMIFTPAVHLVSAVVFLFLVDCSVIEVASTDGLDNIRRSIYSESKKMMCIFEWITAYYKFKTQLDI